MSATAAKTANWEAFLQLKLIAGEDKTRLVPVKRYGPLSVQRPFYPERQVCHVYLLHPPGGVVGGDRLNLQLQLESASKALFTTPGATKFYLSAGAVANIEQQLDVNRNAQLEYLPQENIYFPGAKVKAKTSLSVDDDCDAIMWEKHCFGLPVNNALYSCGQVITELEVRHQGRLLFIEKQRIDAQEIRRASGLRNHAIMGTLLVYSQRLDEALLTSLRCVSAADGECGITQPAENLLIARFIGASSSELNRYFIQLLDILRPVVMQRAVCHPRIWNT